jgi:hypothetical protein
MPEKPFREKNPARKPRAAVASDKSEFEDKVHQENKDLQDRLKGLEDKMLDPKAEKNEAKDISDIEKIQKESKDSKDHKHEKSEKERLIKEVHKQEKSEKELFEVGVFQAPTIPDPRIEQRIAALENVVGRLVHFIPTKSRPDLSKGALQQEPDQPPKGSKRT